MVLNDCDIQQFIHHVALYFQRRKEESMIYEVDFSIKTKSNFKTIFSTLVFAHTVNQCKERASEIAKEKSIKDTQIYIQELIIPEE